MAIGKWSMYISGVLFLLIGLGSLAVALIPDADNWFVNETIDASTDDSFDDPFFDEGREAIDDAVDEGGWVKLTAWILAGSFIPMAFLFFWCGRWFGSRNRELGGMFGGGIPYNPMAQGAGVPGPVPHTTPMPTGQPPVPNFKDPVGPPPDGFIK